jgi:hypothetical protein
VGTNTVVSTEVSAEDFRALYCWVGRAGKLTAYLLAKTVEQGVSKYLMEVNSKLV